MAKELCAELPERWDGVFSGYDRNVVQLEILVGCGSRAKKGTRCAFHFSRREIRRQKQIAAILEVTEI
jgi:hypothetical protein